MRFLAISIALGALTLGDFALSSSALAGPPGWRCEFARTVYGRKRGGGREFTYSCFGQSLRATRRLARIACAQLSNCQRGACVPVYFRPRLHCDRTP